MGSFTCCLVRTAPINATIIINDCGSILSAATLGWLGGVGEPVCWGTITHSLFRDSASSSLQKLLEQSRGWPECVGCSFFLLLVWFSFICFNAKGNFNFAGIHFIRTMLMRTSLVIQWLGLCVFTAGSLVQSLIGELRATL